MKKVITQLINDQFIRFDAAYPQSIFSVKNDLIEKINKLEFEEWISVEDKLPEPGQIILGYNGRIQHCLYRAGCFFRHTDPCDMDRIINYYHNDITHWKFVTPPIIEKQKS